MLVSRIPSPLLWFDTFGDTETGRARQACRHSKQAKLASEHAQRKAHKGVRDGLMSKETCRNAVHFTLKPQADHVSLIQPWLGKT